MALILRILLTILLIVIFYALQFADHPALAALVMFLTLISLLIPSRYFEFGHD